jgi:DNA-binding MurR/RpiR family transcriptional regulator
MINLKGEKKMAQKNSNDFFKSESILKTIRLYINSDKATTTKKDIGNFILNNYEELPNMQLDDLIDKVEASKSTVHRFFKSLNLNGYKDLIFKINRELNEYEVTKPQIKHEETIEFKISKFFSIINLMKEKNSFTPSENKVFDYLVNNLKEVSHLSIRAFSDKSDVSTATILNFINNHLNVNSYLELKKLLSEYFYRREALNDVLSSSYPSYSYKSENSLFDPYIISFLLNSIESNIYKILTALESKTEQNFNDLIKNSSNILIFDLKNTSVNLLHNNLNDLGFPNFHINSYEKALEKIDVIKKNSEIKKNSLSESLKKHINQKKEFINSNDISTNLLNHIAEKTINERNLIIIMATDKYNKKINDIIDKSTNNNFSIILFEANHTAKAIGKYPEINLRINIGDSFIVNENNTRETITLTIVLEILINQFKKSISQNNN